MVVNFSHIGEDKILCQSDLVLGNGLINNIKNILYVDLDKFDISQSQMIAHHIEKFNKKIGKKNPYLLIGPGRWGSSDPWLGIPVSWNQISNAKVIIELSIEGLEPDPSFGSHFFQNLTSLHLAYFTLNKKLTQTNINWDLLSNFKTFENTDCLHWIKLKEPLQCIVDGTSGKGIIVQD